MANVSITVDLSRVTALMAKLSPQQISARGKAAMNESLALAQSSVQGKTPVDTGRLRGSVFTELRGSLPPEMRGKVASPLDYAIVVEEGRKSRRFPPISAVAVWARRHGMNPFVAARAIAMHPGPGKHMFRDGARIVQGRIGSIWLRHFSRLL